MGHQLQPRQGLASVHASCVASPTSRSTAVLLFVDQSGPSSSTLQTFQPVTFTASISELPRHPSALSKPALMIRFLACQARIAELLRHEDGSSFFLFTTCARPFRRVLVAGRPHASLVLIFACVHGQAASSLAAVRGSELTGSMTSSNELPRPAKRPCGPTKVSAPVPWYLGFIRPGRPSKYSAFTLLALVPFASHHIRLLLALSSDDLSCSMGGLSPLSLHGMRQEPPTAGLS